MNRVLIGSSAMKHWFPDFNREPKDEDYAILDRSHKIKGDCMVIPLVCENSTESIATPEMLLTLKLSHIFWDNNWDKHMWDIQFLLDKGVDYNKELFLELVEFWKQHYRLNRSNLKQSSEDFFNNALDSKYEHDYIHTLIADPPAYKQFLKGEVELDETKVLQASNEEKDKLIQEEIMVMAWERFHGLYYKKAYFFMLKKYIREHIPMYLFDYIIKNYKRLDRPPYNFIDYIDAQLDDQC